MIWLLPLVPLSCGGLAGAVVSAVFLAACWTTTQVFPTHYADLLNFRYPGPELLLGRNVLLVLLWVLLLAAVRTREGSPEQKGRVVQRRAGKPALRRALGWVWLVAPLSAHVGFRAGAGHGRAGGQAGGRASFRSWRSITRKPTVETSGSLRPGRLTPGGSSSREEVSGRGRCQAARSRMIRAR